MKSQYFVLQLRSLRFLHSRFCPFGFFCRAFKIQGEQLFQDLLILQIGGPAVRGSDGSIKFLVREIEPGRALVVKFSQRAVFELRGAIGIARFKAWVMYRLSRSLVEHH